ncbi:glycosyltransferase family 4 protein [Gramella sp. GC03-9]|uniref:Glycosyltransferase family 4 protein n=1 Tax=Christiangramia oceanisediminis TaxID=2920386 RepID=A0A9X2KY41_9FLAO|nr:glycosyltransferase family 4 protein [Gramella oceanisediminis]MCP9200384.1 glycosyltransferase family 4 protein [Gramella oceanisediminis]
MPKILVIGYVWPEPASSAAGSRMMQLLQLFRKINYQVIFATAAKETENMEDLGRLGIQTEKIRLNHSSFDDFLAEVMPEIVLFDRFMMEEQFGWRVDKICPGAIKILDTEDLHFLRKAREQAIKKQLAEAELYQELEITKREISAIYRCDLSLIISEFEMNLLQDEFRVLPEILLYLPYLLDIPDTPDIAGFPSFDHRKDFLFIGNFLHAPNWDSVLFLKEKIWPGIRKRLPDANLHIYGAYATEKNFQLRNKQQGFFVHGWASDSSKLMQQARICLAPIRFGAGLKGKFIDAMQNGTPSITTKIGAEGISIDDSWPGLIVEEPDDIIEKSIQLYEDQQLWQQKQLEGFELLRIRFDQKRFSEALISEIQGLKTKLHKHRKTNFTGEMLKHHLHRSTYFMSRFIEEKNRDKN